MACIETHPHFALATWHKVPALCLIILYSIAVYIFWCGFLSNTSVQPIPTGLYKCTKTTIILFTVFVHPQLVVLIYSLERNSSKTSCLDRHQFLVARLYESYNNTKFWSTHRSWRIASLKINSRWCPYSTEWLLAEAN